MTTNNPETNPQEKEEPQKESILKGIGVGLVRAPVKALGGTFDFAADIGEIVGNGVSAVDQKYLDGRIQKRVGRVTNTQAWKDMNSVLFSADGDTNFGNRWSDSESFGRIGNDTANQVTSEIGAVIGAFGGLRSVVQRGTKGKLDDLSNKGKVLVEGAVLGGAAEQVLDPDLTRIADLLYEGGVEQPEGFMDILATSEDDGVLEKRMSAFIEGGALGAVGELAVRGIAKWWKATRRGDTQAAAIAESELKEGLQAQAKEHIGEPPSKLDTPEEQVTDALDQDFAVTRKRQALEKATKQQDTVAESVDEVVPEENPVEEGVATEAVDGDKPSTPKPGAALTKLIGRISGRSIAKKAKPVAATIDKDTVTEDFINLLAEHGVEYDVNPRNLEMKRGRIVVPDEVAQELNSKGVTRSIISEYDASKIPADEGALIRPEGSKAALNQSTMDDFLNEVAVRKTGEIPSPVQDKNIRRTSGRQQYLKYGDADGVQATMRSLVNASDFEKKVMSDEEVLSKASQIADSLGMRAEDVIAHAKQTAEQAELSSIHFKAVETNFARASRALDELSIDDIAKMDEADLENVYTSVHNAIALAEYNARISSQSGRALRLRRIPDADEYLSSLKDGEGAKLAARHKLGDNEIPKLPYSKEELVQWLKDFQSTAGDPHTRQGFLRDAIEAKGPIGYLSQTLSNVFVSNVLSGLNTVTLAAFGPAVMSPFRTAEKAVGALAVSGYNVVRGDLKAAAMNVGFAEDAVRGYTYAATMAGKIINQGLRRGYKAVGDEALTGTQNYARGVRESFRQGKSTLGGKDSFGSTFDIDMETRVPLDRGTSVASKSIYALGNVLNWAAVRPQRRIYGAIDDMAVRTAYLGERYVRLAAEAREQGMRGKELRTHVRNALEDEMADIRLSARDRETLREAQRTTLMLQAGTPGGASEAFHRGVNAVRMTNPVVRAALPVYNTPMAGVGEAFRRIPGLGAMFPEANAEIRGLKGARQQAEAVGRMIVAGQLLTYGYMLAEQGYLTGPGPSDPRSRKAWMNAGYQPWSIKAGDQWVDYSRWDAVGMMLGTTASLHDDSIYLDSEKTQYNKVFGAMAAIQSFIIDRAAVQTMLDTMAAEQQGMNASALERFVDGSITSLTVPNSIRSITNVTDGKRRQTTSLYENIMSRLPVVGERLPVQLDLLGDEIVVTRDTVTENVLPYVTKKVITPEDDDIRAELGRIYSKTGSAPGLFSDASLGRGSFRSSDLKLGDLDYKDFPKDYNLKNAFLAIRADIEIEGKTLKQSLKELISSEAYLQAVDADSSHKTVSDLRAGEVVKSRAYLLNQVFSRYNKKAKMELAKSSNKANDYMTAAKLRSSGSTALEQFSVDELVDNPSLFTSLGIDFDATRRDNAGLPPASAEPLPQQPIQ